MKFSSIVLGLLLGSARAEEETEMVYLFSNGPTTFYDGGQERKILETVCQ